MHLFANISSLQDNDVYDTRLSPKNIGTTIRKPSLSLTLPFTNWSIISGWEKKTSDKIHKSVAWGGGEGLYHKSSKMLWMKLIPNLWKQMDEETDWGSDASISSTSNQLSGTSSSTTATPNKPNSLNRTDSSMPGANYTATIKSEPSTRAVQSERTRYNQIEHQSNGFCNSQIASG